MSDILSVLSDNLPSLIDEIKEPFFCDSKVELFLKRDDLIHPDISGNKWRKLKYNLVEAKKNSHDSVLTFGGAYSNHIAATAVACKLAGLKSIGIIRGEELSINDNHTLNYAHENGMRLVFVSREEYRRKNEEAFIIKLKDRFGEFYSVPEGGANELGAKGCVEILQEVKEAYDYICVACGTGTTMAGIVSASNKSQEVIGFPALKGGEFLKQEIKDLIGAEVTNDFKLVCDYHFGGYAKHTEELLQFIKAFWVSHSIDLDFIYTGKMMFGVYDLIKQGYFAQGSKILAIHTGGLQGNRGIPKLFN